MRRLRSPLLAASLAGVAGGLGNLAFVAHSGTQVQLAASRFVAGVPVALLMMAASRVSPRPLLLLRLQLPALLSAAAILLAVTAAATLPILPLTVIGLLSPVILLLGGVLLDLPRPTAGQTAAAAVAVAAAAAASLSYAEVQAGASTAGLLSASASMLLGSASALLWARTGGSIPASRLLLSICMWGSLLSLPPALLWHADIPLSSLAAGAFIAAVPGGLGLLALSWAIPRMPPFLASSAGSLSLVTVVAADLLSGRHVPMAAALAAPVAAAAVAAMRFPLRHPTDAAPSAR